MEETSHCVLCSYLIKVEIVNDSVDEPQESLHGPYESDTGTRIQVPPPARLKNRRLEKEAKPDVLDPAIFS